MTKPFVNFLSYNSTGIDSVKTDWVRTLVETCDISFLQLQEHFRASKTVDNYFKKEFPSKDSYVIPAHREPGQDSGRPKGGLAQISDKSLDIRRERINSRSFRLQAQVLHFGDFKLLWINAYFPTDPQTVNFDQTELLQVQTEIESILDSSNYDEVLLGGDFNYDKRRLTSFTISMDRFLEKLGLRSVWEKFSIDFTHIHTDMKSTSVLDNFFVSEGLLDSVIDAGALHLGDNLSRHSPIMIKIQLETIRKEQKSRIRKRRPAWYKATDEDKGEYTSILDEKLSEVEYPESLGCADIHCKHPDHSTERDKFVIDILCNMIETTYECIPLSAKPKSEDKVHSKLCT